jgi:t-SNARE complex subunit (syntaxin)
MQILIQLCFLDFDEVALIESKVTDIAQLQHKIAENINLQAEVADNIQDNVRITRRS